MSKANEAYIKSLIDKPIHTNVFDQTGRLLLEVGSIMTESIAKRLILADINIPKPRKRADASAPVQLFEAPPPLTQDKHFRSFNQTYENKKVAIGQIIKDISAGSIVDIDLIYRQTESMMSELDNIKDLLKYLSFIEGTDDITHGHSINVSLLCNLFGQWLELPDDELKILTVAGMLHDIGKTQIPQEILLKKGRLTDEEFAVIKTHSEQGYKILNERKVDLDVQYAALMHHEKLDGSGYPLGLTGDNIHKIASIVTICDIYDAMTANRSYRKKLCPFAIIQSFENNFYGQLHTEYLIVFLEKISHSFKNHMVRLSNGEIGEVMFIHPRAIARPMVRLLTGEFIDLSRDSSIDIDEVF